MAASSFTASTIDNPGGLRIKRVVMTPSTSYPTGGEPITATQAGLTSILTIIPAGDAAGRLWVYQGNGKVKAYRTAAITVAGGAAAAGTDALSVKANVLNKESASAATVVAQGDLAEVASTTDLSATTVELIVLGT